MVAQSLLFTVHVWLGRPDDYLRAEERRKSIMMLSLARLANHAFFIRTTMLIWAL